MPYQPYLIADFKTAKYIEKEPWLSPQDGFPTLENLIINKGVMSKRNGFSPFATMKHGAVAQTDTTITGIKAHIKKTVPSLLITDSARANYYNAVDLSMADVSSDVDTPIDIFTSSNFMHFNNWRGVLYMTNNVDQIHKWEGPGSAVEPFNIQIDSSDELENQISTCQYTFIIDDRIFLIAPVELGTWYPQRFRYGPVLQTDFTASGGGTDDAETQQRITAAGKIGGTVYAYFEGPDGGSLWKIRRTGNTSIPYEWHKLTPTEGSPAPFSAIEWNDGLVAVGLSNIMFTRGTAVKPIKFMDIPNVRDILTEFENNLIRNVYGFLHRETGQNHLLFSFGASGSSVVDRILDYNASENNYTIHKSAQSFFVNVFGAFNGQQAPTWSEADDVFGTDGDTMANADWDSREIAGNPSIYTLIGCRNSQVYKWNDGEFDGTDDANGKIAINALSGRWNPFNKIGRKVACQKIGILVDNDANASFLASVYKSSGSVAYATKTISCEAADDSLDKFWVWIFCDGEVGNFHRLQISHTEKGNTPKIHAWMPYFEQAGELCL